jgi:hypothetical protein
LRRSTGATDRNDRVVAAVGVLDPPHETRVIATPKQSVAIEERRRQRGIEPPYSRCWVSLLLHLFASHPENRVMSLPPTPATTDSDRARRVAELVERNGWDPERISPNHPVFAEVPDDLESDRV